MMYRFISVKTTRVKVGLARMIWSYTAWKLIWSELPTCRENQLTNWPNYHKDKESVKAIAPIQPTDILVIGALADHAKGYSCRDEPSKR